MTFTREGYENEKARLKALGHTFDESESDYFFSAADGDPTTIRLVWEAMRKSPNPRAEEIKKFTDSLGENFSAAAEEFEGIVR